MNQLNVIEKVAPSIECLGARVLVVDDDESVREFVSAALRFEGYLVSEACNGMDALRKVSSAKLPFHVVLSDVEMPLLKGTELFKILRGEHPWIGLLLMSGQPGMYDGATGRRMEGFKLMQKPFSLEALFENVRMVLTRRNAM